MAPPLPSRHVDDSSSSSNSSPAVANMKPSSNSPAAVKLLSSFAAIQARHRLAPPPTAISSQQQRLSSNSLSSISDVSTKEISYNNKYNCKSILRTTNGNKKIFVLHAFYAGAKPDLFHELQQELINDDNSSLSKSNVKLSKIYMQEEIIRRHNYLCSKKKEPRNAGWNIEQCMTTLCEIEYQLPSLEIKFIENELQKFYDQHQMKRTIALERLADLGNDISKTDRE
jgi:hypothetical protein